MINQWTINAAVGCGIISPSCDAHLAASRSFSAQRHRKLHIATKNALKSPTNVSDRHAVSTVHRTPYRILPTITLSYPAFLAWYSFSSLFRLSLLIFSVSAFIVACSSLLRLFASRSLCSARFFCSSNSLVFFSYSASQCRTRISAF